MSATPANEFDRHSTNSKEEGEDKLITTRDLEEQPKTEIDKLGGYDLWKNMGEPKYVVAPMVDQSELVRTTLPARTSRFAAELPRFRFSLTLESFLGMANLVKNVWSELMLHSDVPRRPLLDSTKVSTGNVRFITRFNRRSSSVRQTAHRPILCE